MSPAAARKIFVAGGTGVLGRRVVPLLVEAGHDVLINTRNPEAMASAEAAGAHTTTVDLFNADAVAEAAAGRDAVIHIATSIPTGPGSVSKRGWAMNDRLRTEASANLAAAVPAGGRYVGESITFPYADCGDDWIDESVARDTTWATASVEAAEAAATSVDRGVVLRFAMFWAADSAHNDMAVSAAKRGFFALLGPPEAYASWVHIDDAAGAVVAALDAPAGIYNVAEPNPLRRSDHMAAMAKVFGRKRLRPVPNLAVRLGGPPAEALARSQRISSTTLAEATTWEPKQDVVTHWTQDL